MTARTSARTAAREARTEAALVVAIDLGLYAALAIVDKAKGWDIIDLPWWALLFWQLDEGGPQQRAERDRSDPDFEFPQDATPRPDWAPRLGDYLYVSLTNAIAVSPTDTMPLSRRAKALMAVESLISYAVVILVVARAVNVLGS